MNKLIILLAICTLGLANSHAGEGKKDKMKKWDEKVKKELNLTDEQSKEITEIKDKYNTELKGLMDQRNKLRKELADMTKQADTSENFNKTLTNKHNELQGVNKDLQDKRFVMLLETREILKPDQLAKMDKLFMKSKHKRWDKNKKRQSQEEAQQ